MQLGWYVGHSQHCWPAKGLEEEAWSSKTDVTYYVPRVPSRKTLCHLTSAWLLHIDVRRTDHHGHLWRLQRRW